MQILEHSFDLPLSFMVSFIFLSLNSPTLTMTFAWLQHRDIVRKIERMRIDALGFANCLDSIFFWIQAAMLNQPSSHHFFDPAGSSNRSSTNHVASRPNHKAQLVTASFDTPVPSFVNQNAAQ